MLDVENPERQALKKSQSEDQKMIQDGLEDAKTPLTDPDNSSNATTTDFQTQRLSNKLDKGAENIPKDSGNTIYLTFLLYGIGVLLPFNVIMACLDYYAVVVSSSRYSFSCCFYFRKSAN